jgi:hypothetical protein
MDIHVQQNVFNLGVLTSEELLKSPVDGMHVIFCEVLSVNGKMKCYATLEHLLLLPLAMKR